MRNGTEQDEELLSQTRSLLTKFASLESIDWLEADKNSPASSAALVGNLELLGRWRA